MVESLWSTMKEQEEANPSIALLHERMAGNLRLIGLTGGIASGKSTISKFLQEAGIPSNLNRHVRNRCYDQSSRCLQHAIANHSASARL